MNFHPAIQRDITFPWVFRHQAFTPDECDRAINLGLKREEKRATLIGQEAGADVSETRISKVRWLSPDDETTWLFSRVAEEMSSLNKQFYGFDLWGFDTLQFTQYDSSEQGHYAPHLDMALGIVDGAPMPTRKLSASILLNDWFLGGELAFRSRNFDEPIAAEMGKGTIVVFPSFIWHEVMPVSKGTRYSLVAWALGPKFT